MDIHFILYRPGVPGNIGASARAIKVMGFSSLVLIDPCDHLGEEARTLAHGSTDILETARVYNSFEEAVRDLELVICTTAKGRSAKHDYHSSRDLGRYLENKLDRIDQVGVVFGTEESGLPNQVILQCDLAMSIPMFAPYPSLNLSQAVMVTAYELSRFNNLHKPGKPIEKSGEGFGTLKKQARELVIASGIEEGTPLYHRIMERLATIGANDIPLLLSVIKGMRKPG